MVEEHALYEADVEGSPLPLVSVDGGALFVPPKGKVNNLKSKTFMAKSEVRVNLDEKDKSVEFKGEKLIEQREVNAVSIFLCLVSHHHHHHLLLLLLLVIIT